ncbi:unnamed protein product [Allacma fusca]|uniref:Uncharacterized protein n=1 Tax=Allacma fusca TaxID=39272 RepID=A0A8J2PEH2_9HEXA|nr:unnamed protein product [Allacma fusca]
MSQKSQGYGIGTDRGRAVVKVEHLLKDLLEAFLRRQVDLPLPTTTTVEWDRRTKGSATSSCQKNSSLVILPVCSRSRSSHQ